MQIRDGLHVLGASPAGRQRVDTLVAIARAPRTGGRPADASLHRAIAADLGLGGFDPLDCDPAAAWDGPRPAALAALSDAPWRTAGDTVERIELLAAELVGSGRRLPRSRIPSTAHPRRKPGIQFLQGDARSIQDLSNPGRAAPFAIWIPACAGTSGSGEAVRRPAPSSPGSRRPCPRPRCIGQGRDRRRARRARRAVRRGPDRRARRRAAGRRCCRPGRNFYTVDIRAVPTAAAWALGRAAADAMALRYFQDEGEWPRSIAMSAWGTSNMRTGGDDIAAGAGADRRRAGVGSGHRARHRVPRHGALRAGAAADRRDAPHLRHVPRRLPRADRADGVGLPRGRRARRRRDGQPDRRRRRGTADWRSRGSSARSPAPTAPACRR